MGYKTALQAAGATVLAFKEFGSYQGDWYAKVYFNGITAWVTGSYGSCSGCDAFEAEFGWSDESELCNVHRYGTRDDLCPGCDALKGTYQTRLAAFGSEYLNDFRTQEEVEEYASENLSWDADAETMVSWLKEHST